MNIQTEHLADLAVEVLGLAKSYGTVIANRDVSLNVRRGEIHAVVGENGAGKTTLMSVLAGMVRPDVGSVTVLGTEGGFASPRAASRAGVGLVHQEFTLAPDLTVLENIVLGWEGALPGGWRRRGRERERVNELMARYAMPLPLDSAVGGLAVAHRQQVEILKVLFRDAELMIFDEPTAVLTPHERDGLFAALRSLRDQGAAIIIVGHKLGEIIDIADRITVMRAGQTVATLERGEATIRELATLIVGSEVDAVRVDARAAGPTVLELHGVRVGPARKPLLDAVDLEVSANRIVGVAGVAGSGQNELMELCAGLREASAGRIVLHTATDVDFAASRDAGPDRVRRLRSAGVAYIPQDRRDVATLAERGLWRSIAPLRWTLTERLRRYRPAILREVAADVIASGSVKAHSANAHPSELSGGNLQKYVVSRELSTHPRLVLAEDPTRGVDIGSATAIRQQLRAAAEAGAAVLLASTDLDELLQVSDEIVVLHDGRIAARFDRENATLDKLGAAMTGALEDA